MTTPRSLRTPRRLSRTATALTLALGVLGGTLAATVPASTSQAATSAPRTLQGFAAAGGVQDSPDNLTSPEAGVSRVHLDKGKMNGYKVRAGITSTDEATLTYQVRVPKDVHDNGLAKIDLKMPGLAGSPTSKSPWYASSGGTLQSDSFSVRLHARKSSLYDVGYPWWDAYVYAPRAAGKTFEDWGIQVPITTGTNGAGARLGIPVDRWFDVEIHMKLNTPGRDDGVLDISIDGVRGIALKDVRYRAAGVETPINLLMAETFYNNPGAPQDGFIDFRDFRITAGAPVSTPAPGTPAPVVKDPVVKAPVGGTPPTGPALAVERGFRVLQNGWGPAEVNRSNGSGAKGDGSTLTIAGKTYARGFGVHAASEILVPVQGSKTFTASVGVDAGVGTRGSVVFQVWNGNRKIADSGVVRGGAAARALTADVAGAKEIRLVVTDAGDGRSHDHANWASPKFS